MIILTTADHTSLGSLAEIMKSRVLCPGGVRMGFRRFETAADGPVAAPERTGSLGGPSNRLAFLRHRLAILHLPSCLSLVPFAGAGRLIAT